MIRRCPSIVITTRIENMLAGKKSSYMRGVDLFLADPQGSCDSRKFGLNKI